MSILDEGCTPADYVQIVRQWMTSAEALKLETQMIAVSEPRFNSDRRRSSLATRIEMVKAHEDGLSFQEISDKFGVRKMTCFKYVKELKEKA